MKLIELLREHLNNWPMSCRVIAQDKQGGVFYWQKTPVFDGVNCVWTHPNGVVEALLDGEHYFLKSEDDVDGFATCEDYSTAIITRTMYEAAMKEPQVPKVEQLDLIKARDRVIAIEKEQIALQNEKRDLYSAINEAGFKLDLSNFK